MKPTSIKKVNTLTSAKIQEYEELALKQGATHTAPILAQEVIMDYRAYYKCIIPKCPYYNTNIHCPPFAPSFLDMEKLVNCYEAGILIGVKLPPTAVTGKGGKEKGKNALVSSEVVAGRLKIHEIVTRVEARAFYDGFYFATAFSGGSCKAAWCPDRPCQVLEAGKACRFPLRGRPCMEGVGMDVYRMASNAGWEIYPVGSCSKNEEVPHGMRVGLVLIQ